MQDTVNQVHGAVPRALADIVGVIGVSSWPTACRTISSIWVPACRAGGNERIVGRVQQVPAGLLGVCGSLRGKASASLSVCRRHSTFRMGGSCPAVAPSCSPLPGQPMPGHRPPNVWLLGLTMSQQERCPGIHVLRSDFGGGRAVPPFVRRSR